MTERRKDLVQLLRKQLMAAGTFPGITTAILKIMVTGFQQTWIETYNESIPLESMVLQAIKSQQHLGNNSIAKGYQSKLCKTCQTEWEKQAAQPNRNQNWTKEAVCAIHTYTLGVWKIRNTFKYGNTKHSSRAQRRELLQKRIEILYKKPCSCLKQKDHIHFKLPVEQRKKKKSMEAME